MPANDPRAADQDSVERQAPRSVERFAAHIANELRPPLLGISSATQLMRFRAQGDPVLERNIGRILRELERLNALATELLEHGQLLQPRRPPTDPDAESR